MKVKGILEEDRCSYKKPSMTILTTKCSMKCNAIDECHFCSSAPLLALPDIEITKEELCQKYIDNPNTQAIVFSGLEPFDTEMDLLPFIDCLRSRFKCKDDIVIYTGYSEKELESGFRTDGCAIGVEQNLYSALKGYENIIIKFGKYISNSQPRIDDILGIQLPSDNQYAVKIS